MLVFPIKPNNDSNSWHQDWMQNNPNSYEWWYVDAVSNDNKWSLVVIFLLGSPFSEYSYLCSKNRNPDPLAYNGVFVTLHHESMLRYYLYARYPKDRIKLTSATPLSLQFGPNLFLQGSDGGFRIHLDETNANNRQITADFQFSANRQVNTQPFSLIPNHESHFWQPITLGTRFCAEIALQNPAITKTPELIRFEGSVYHDHNWGVLPFADQIKRWIWARADFGDSIQAVLYHVESHTGNPQTFVLIQDREGVFVEENAKIEEINYRWDIFPVRYLSQITTTVSDLRIKWEFRETLENTPFYRRSLVKAELFNNQNKRFGIGIGEILEPKTMGLKVFAGAMRQRIYEPDL